LMVMAGAWMLWCIIFPFCPGGINEITWRLF